MRSAFRDLNGSDFKPDSASLHCVDAGCGAHIVLRATDSTKLKNISGGAPIYFLTSYFFNWTAWKVAYYLFNWFCWRPTILRTSGLWHISKPTILRTLEPGNDAETVYATRNHGRNLWFSGQNRAMQTHKLSTRRETIVGIRDFPVRFEPGGLGNCLRDAKSS